MYQTLFVSHLPMIKAFLNPRDSTRRTWDDVVCWIFKMNNNKAISAMTELAEWFVHCNRPLFFRIDLDELEKYFIGLRIDDVLKKSKCKEHEHYINTETKTKISFVGLSKCIMGNGDDILNNQYEFVAKVYQIYIAYMTMKRQIPTHWTLVERTSNFSSYMQPHVAGKEKRHKIMEIQPRVFCILKGSLKTLQSRVDKYIHADDSLYSPDFKMPIYHSILQNVNDEIDLIIKWLKQEYLVPYQESQQNVKRPLSNIHLTRRIILIDPSQDKFTPCMLRPSIEDMRTLLKQGKDSEVWNTPPPTKPTIVNFVDLNIFNRTKGQYMDDQQTLRLHYVSDEDLVVANVPIVVNQFIETIVESSLNKEEDEEEKEEVKLEEEEKPEVKLEEEEKPEVKLEEEEKPEIVKVAPVKKVAKPKAEGKVAPVKKVAKPKTEGKVASTVVNNPTDVKASTASKGPRVRTSSTTLKSSVQRVGNATATTIMSDDGYSSSE